MEKMYVFNRIYPFNEKKEVKEFCFKLQNILETLGYKGISVNYTIDKEDLVSWVRIYIKSDKIKTQYYTYHIRTFKSYDVEFELLYLAKQFLERKVLNG